MESKEALNVENQKSAIFLKGNKCSLTISAFMKDFYKIRGAVDNSKLFLRKSHDYHPFDNAGPLELFSKN